MTDKKRPINPTPQDIRPEVDAPIMAADRTHDSDEARLDTGMKVGEAISRACIWWETKGRNLIRDKNFASDNPGFGAFNPNPRNAIEATNWLPSGIMAGKPWVDLTRDEKLRVTRWWHHFHVRVPNIDPELYLRAKARLGKCFYCDQQSVADEWLTNPQMGHAEHRELCMEHYADRYPAEAKALLQDLGPANDA